jgi:hypothetical protein
MINGMVAVFGDHAIYLELLVGVAGFEPAPLRPELSTQANKTAA